jgi:hypothetical protein
MNTALGVCSQITRSVFPSGIMQYACLVCLVCIHTALAVGTLVTAVHNVWMSRHFANVKKGIYYPLLCTTAVCTNVWLEV